MMPCSTSGHSVGGFGANSGTGEATPRPFVGAVPLVERGAAFSCSPGGPAGAREIVRVLMDQAAEVGAAAFSMATTSESR